MGWRGPAPELGGIHPHQAQSSSRKQILGLREPARLEPGAVPELDGEDIARVPLTGTQHRLAARGAGHQPGWELVVHRAQLPGSTERGQCLEEGPLLLRGRGAGAALLALMTGQAPVGLDVEEEVIRGAGHPPGDPIGCRDPVEAGVDLELRGK